MVEKEEVDEKEMADKEVEEEENREKMEKGEELAETKMTGRGGRIKGSKPGSRLSDVCEGLCRLFFPISTFNHRYLSEVSSLFPISTTTTRRSQSMCCW